MKATHMMPHSACQAAKPRLGTAVALATLLLAVPNATSCNDRSTCAEKGGYDSSFNIIPPCDPTKEHKDGWICCSDDPAALGGGLPDYPFVDGDVGAPLFSADKNDASSFGLCGQEPDKPRQIGNRIGETIDGYCPPPCNPTWTEDEIGHVCGSFSICCQSVSIEEDDCFFDGDIWRPIRGTDMVDPEDWANLPKGTRQDPDLTQCRNYAEGADDYEVAIRACVDALTAADQRGFCVVDQGPDYCGQVEDPCAAMNG